MSFGVAMGLAAGLCAPAPCPPSPASPVAARTVLTIYSGAPNFPSNPVLDAGVREALTSRADVAIDDFSEYLEDDLFPETRASLAFSDYIHRKYHHRRIDLVITFTNRALQFALRHRSELFPNAPIVFGAVTAPAEGVRRAGAGVTGITDAAAPIETLRLALALHPSTERVFVVAESHQSPTVESVRARLREFSRRVSITYMTQRTAAGLLAAVKAVPPRSVILYIRQSVLEPGRIVYPDEMARMVAQAASVPVYGTSDLYIGSGVVGGVVQDTRATGTRLGEMALRILSGTRAQDIPVEVLPLRPIVDWREVERWGISQSRLPPHSDVRFRAPTPWESSGQYDVAVIVIAAQLLLIGALLTERAFRRRALHTLRAREATLRTRYDGIRQLNARMIKAQESARAEIARELHDDVCQELVGVSLALSGLRGSSGDFRTAQARETLSTLHDTTTRLVAGVRRLSQNLHPGTLQLVGLAPALRAHCIEVERRHDVQVTFASKGDFGQIHPDTALGLYRVAEEALRNAAVHGEARRIAVSVEQSKQSVVLTVADDGIGFDVNAVRRSGAGLGLVSMDERAHLLSGTMKIVSRARYGTMIVVQVPTATRATTVSHDEPSAQLVRLVADFS